jgi:two-component system, OmpR family, sensor histidine kinase VicK
LAISDEIAPKKKGRTEIIYDMDVAISYGVDFLQNSRKRMDVLIDESGPSLIIKYNVYKDNYIKARSRGVKIRFVTEITKENVSYCKELRNIVDELKHLGGLKGSISVNESEFLGSTTWSEKQLLNPVTYSNEKEVVEQQQYIFDTFWKNAIPFEQRKKEIEEGIVPGVIETSNDHKDFQSKVFSLLNSASNEILVLFSTSNAFHRQANDGSIQKIKEIRNNKPWITIKILTPKDTEIEKIADELVNSNFIIRFIEPLSKVSILIVDRKYSLVAEVKDDTKLLFIDAVGFVTYSNSVPTVLSYAAIFDCLWSYIAMVQQLQIHDKMQKEFINTAAHELRTPIQPILGITELIRDELKDDKYREFLDVISRNAHRLKKLSEDIFDVTRIESNTLFPYKEYFDIKGLIIDTIESYKNIAYSKHIRFEEIVFDDLIIYADKISIGRVISNLISNSIKFIPHGGLVSIVFKRKRIAGNGDNNKEIVVVSIKDDGLGIRPEVFPKLFTKFTTTSFQGMGLGLYISKNIVELHGGRIWAENNKGDKGSTFSFSLPLNG